jgi:hypothetical protein
MKKLILALCLSLHLSAYAQVNSDFKRDIAKTLITNYGTNEQVDEEGSKLMQKLASMVHQDVIQGIEQEASGYKMSRDAYVENILSMDNFISNIKDIDIESLDKVDAFILAMEVGMRLQIQSHLRFEYDGFAERRKQVILIAKELTEKVGVTL